MHGPAGDWSGPLEPPHRVTTSTKYDDEASRMMIMMMIGMMMIMMMMTMVMTMAMIMIICRRATDHNDSGS